MQTIFVSVNCPSKANTYSEAVFVKTKKDHVMVYYGCQVYIMPVTELTVNGGAIILGLNSIDPIKRDFDFTKGLDQMYKYISKTADGSRYETDMIWKMTPVVPIEFQSNQIVCSAYFGQTDNMFVYFKIFIDYIPVSKAKYLLSRTVNEP